MIGLDRLWQDVRHTCRLLAKNPGFAAIAVLSIAFGTGANVAVFSAADALILRPLPVARPSELVTVGSEVTRGLTTVSVASYPDYLDIRDRTKTFSSLIAFTTFRVGVTATPGAPPRLKMVTAVSDNFFTALGVAPVLGRDFLAEEYRVPGRDAVAIVSYGLWQQELGGDPEVVGRTVRLTDIDFTVVGVAPESFTGVGIRYVESLFVPVAMWSRLRNARAADDPLSDRGYQALNLKGRLHRGVGLDEARVELSVIGADLARAYPVTNGNVSFTAQTEIETRFERNPLDSWLIVILTTLSIAVLAVACANVAGLLASRAPIRAREIALRLAVGAGRAALIRQLIIESLAIALAGGIGGIALGYIGIILLRQIQFPTDLIAVPVMQLDQRALIFSLAVAIASAFLFGIGPALQTTRVDLVSTLKSNDATPTRRQRVTGRNVLIAVQVALSLVLLTFAVFAFHSFQSELIAGPGFRTSQIAKLSVDTGQARYRLQQAPQFFERALDEARRLPGARAATAISIMPLFGWEISDIAPEGYRLPEGQAAVRVMSSVIDEHYFDTMQIAVLRGRAFNARDAADQPRVAIVNDTLARHFWPGDDTLGKRFRLHEPEPFWVEIVGIVKTSKHGYLGEPPQDFVYFPFRQQPRNTMILLVETTGDSASLLAPLRELIRKLDADVPSYDGQTIESFYAARATTIANIILMLIGGMGVMGMILTMIGLYGLVSFAVSRRTRELGIRIAVGATHGRVLRMVLIQGMRPAFFGLAVGLVLSVAMIRMLPTLLPFNYPSNSLAFLIVVPLLLATTIFAALIPARRAARVDPTVALRCE